jgi:hypothetical protein
MAPRLTGLAAPEAAAVARFPRIAPAGAPERDRRVRFRGFKRLPVRVD